MTESEARLDELKRLKKIDCFNEAYSSDPRPSKYIDIRIAELEGKWKVMDASDDIPYGDPEK